MMQASVTPVGRTGMERGAGGCPSPGRAWQSADRLFASALASRGRADRGTVLTDEATHEAEPLAPQDLESFEKAYARHEADVVRVCRRLLGSREDARDASHEVFLRAHRALHTYDRSRPLRPWLLTIAGNYCIDSLRHQATEQRVFVDLDPDEAEPDADAELSSLGRLLAREQRDAVNRAIAELPLKYRVPLALRYFSDLGYEAIGQALGVSRGQVGTLLFRAKRMLREVLQASSQTTRRRRR